VLLHQGTDYSQVSTPSVFAAAVAFGLPEIAAANFAAGTGTS